MAYSSTNIVLIEGDHKYSVDSPVHSSSSSINFQSKLIESVELSQFNTWALGQEVQCIHGEEQCFPGYGLLGSINCKML